MPASPRFRRHARKEEIEFSEQREPGSGAYPPTKHTSSEMVSQSDERRRLLPSMPEEEAVSRSWRDYMPKGHAFTGTVVSLHLVLGTVIWQQLMDPSPRIGDAFYFAVQTFLTIGYGDITPASNTAKAFFILYTVLSLVVQLTVVTTFVASTLSMTPEQDSGPSTAPSEERLKAFFKVRPRIIKAAQGFVLLIGLVTTGACMLRFTYAHEGKNLSWLDCWYWSVTTISTVGYGDIAPTRFRPLFACFFLVAVVLFAFLLGESIALVTELGNYRRMHALFEDGLGPEALAKMDNYQGDGRVTRVEFLMFILQHLKIVDRAEMEHILSLFESCDSNGDGVLDLQDIKTRMSCSSRVAASRAASRAASGAGLRPQSSFSRAAASAIAAVEQETSGCRGDVWL